MVGQGARDDFFKIAGAHTHRTESGGQFQACVHLADRLRDVAGRVQSHGARHTLQPFFVSNGFDAGVKVNNSGQKHGIQRAVVQPRVNAAQAVAQAVHTTKSFLKSHGPLHGGAHKVQAGLAVTAVQRSWSVLAEITGYGISTDNHHLTQPHPSGIGPEMAMTRALADAQREPHEIGYINAHGTATVFNDSSEGVAIAKVFGSRVPVSSTKGMMGHSLGAAGAIEAVFCVLALNEGFLPPNINYREPDPAFDLNIVANTARDTELRAVLSNSFGFGGTNASIILEAVR